MSVTLPSNRPTWRSPNLGEVLTSGMLLPGAEDPSLGFLELLVRDLSLITDCVHLSHSPFLFSYLFRFIKVDSGFIQNLSYTSRSLSNEI